MEQRMIYASPRSCVFWHVSALNDLVLCHSARLVYNKSVMGLHLTFFKIGFCPLHFMDLYHLLLVPKPISKQKYLFCAFYILYIF